MKVAAIQSTLSLYKSYLKRNLDNDQNYKWAVLKTFNTHWNTEALDLHTMYDQSLKNKDSGHLWGGESNSPKSVMKQMISINPDFCRTMFRDLFAEDKELLLRLDRFGYHCDQLMGDVEKQYGKTISHHHHDFKILSVYLALTYPKTYCIYDYPAFKNFAQLIEVKDIPEEYEILRFFKIMRAIYGIISKDIELIELQKKRLNDTAYYQDPSLLLCHDFYLITGSPEYKSSL